MFQKINIFILALFSTFYSVFAADFSPEDIIPEDNANFSTITSETGFGAFDALLAFVRDSFFRLLALIVITIFIIIGAKIIMARGNPEEFKKALWMFLRTCIGLVIIGLSYAAVKLVAGLNF